MCAAMSLALVGLGQARDPVAAEELFRAARALADQGDYESACPKFAASQKLDPAPGTVLNLADCEEKLGKIASAWQHYRQAADALPPTDERVAFARQRALTLEPALPRLTIERSPGAPADTKIFRDGVELPADSMGQALPIDPGEHVIVASSAGRRERSVHVTVARGEAKSIQIAPGESTPTTGPTEPASTAAIQPRDQPAASASPWRTVGWVSGAVGAVGVGAAVVTGLMVLGKKQTVDDACPTKTTCSHEGTAAAETGKTLVAVNAASWIVGIVGLGAGTVLVLTHPNGDATRTAAFPTIVPGGGGLSISGRFQ
jgi:hypothetical protein